VPFWCLRSLRRVGASLLFELNVLRKVDSSDERIKLFLRERDWLFRRMLASADGVLLELANEIVVKVDPFDEQVEVLLRPARDDL
jgi:hypothetical protein